MTIKQLHFKWTVSRGRDTYGYNICTLLIDGNKAGRCLGGGYDMQGTALAEWLQSHYQNELINLFDAEIAELASNEDPETFNRKDFAVKYTHNTKYYGASIYLEKEGPRISLDGAAGFSSMETIAKAININLKWNPESSKYKNHTYYTAIINQ